MLGSALLDVAVGMAFLYLLLSLVASALQEVIAQLIQARAANLLRGLRSMVSNDELSWSGVPFLQAFYNHGLVRSLYQVPGADYQENPFRAKMRVFLGKIRLGFQWIFGMRVPGTKWDVNNLWLPAYIPSRVFAMTVMDLMRQEEEGRKAYEKAIAAAGVQPPAAAAPAQAPAPVTVPKDQIVVVARSATTKLAEEAVRTLMADAGDDPAKVQANLENWYNDTMDRVSGWYKRYTQNVLLVIGLVLAIVFNVSSIKIVRALWVDKDARTALASEAQEYLKQHPGAAAAPVAGADRRPSQGPAGASGASGSTDTASVNPDFAGFGRNLKDTVDAYHGAVDSLLPVGWKARPTAYIGNLFGPQKGLAGGYLLVLLGWIVTAIALSYGAPFWFDVLNKFMVVRSTIKPQEKSQIEPSKD